MSADEESAEERPAVEVRVIGGGAPPGLEPMEEEEVVRLVKTGVEGVRSVEEVDPAPEAGEPVQVARERRKLRKWTLVLSGVLAALVVGSATAVILRRVTDSNRPAPYEGVEVTYATGEDPDDPFLKRADTYLVEAREKIAMLVSAGPPEVVALGRQGGDLRALLEERWEPPLLDDVRIGMLSFELEEDDAGREWVVLSGKDQLLRAVRFVFVPEGEGLAYDWAASVGANEPTLGEFRGSGEGEEAVFRVEVRGDAFYSSRFPESRYLCFKLSDSFADEVSWGYALRGGSVARVLAAALNLDSAIVGREEMARRIVGLRNTGAGAQGQFELIEVVSADWIRWEEE